MQNIAEHCQQTFCFQKFVVINQQYFALLPKVNFPTNNLNFHWRWWDGIQAIFFNLFSFTPVEQPKEPENQSSQEDHKADNAAVVPPDNQSEVTDKKPATERCILTRLCLIT